MTDLEVSAETVAEVFWVGRGRWKIENEQFIVQKHGGYHLEHNYGHGEQTLSTFFYFLNLLAYVTHRVLERSDGLYQRARAQWPARSIWNSFKEMVRLLVFERWEELMRRFVASIEPEGP